MDTCSKENTGRGSLIHPITIILILNQNTCIQIQNLVNDDVVMFFWRHLTSIMHACTLPMPRAASFGFTYRADPHLDS
jgi:hypothetical protein